MRLVGKSALLVSPGCRQSPLYDPQPGEIGFRGNALNGRNREKMTRDTPDPQDLPGNGFQDHIGRRQTACDHITPAMVDRFLATIPGMTGTTPGKAPHHGEPDRNHLPPGFHWCLAPPAEPSHRLGEDGHPRLGTFLPALPYTRRMWAGGSISFHGSLAEGDTIARETTIEAITRKSGSRSEMIFVTLAHEISVSGRKVVSERQDLVYLPPLAPDHAPGRSGKPASIPTRENTATEAPLAVFVTDPVLLFRYSAITFNGHRIHYDADHARNIEGHAGIVVHGPLLATLLANEAARLLRGKGQPLAHFDFRARAPLFCGETVALFAVPSGADNNALELAARCHEDGRLIMSASAG